MIKAYISDRPFTGMSVGIAIVEHPGEGCIDRQARVLRLRNGDGSSWEPVKGGEIPEPTLRLDDSQARALCDALNHHYGGTEDTRALRKDYDAERKRVDDLIGTVTFIAKASTDA